MSGAAAPAELERKPGGRDRLIAIGSIAAVAVAVVLVVMSLGGDDGGSVLPTPTPKASQAPRVEGVAGVWGSTFGDVTLEHDELDGDDPVDVTGSWIQGPDKVGEITSGTFDPSEGTLEIGYTENWEGGVEGTAFFELSEDGDTLSGTYEQPNSRGEWVLSR
jgi:hypothetical protein